MSDPCRYFDHAATTPLAPEALDAMMPYLIGQFANPSSPYASGRAARRAVEDARAIIARCINAEPDEVFFTSGGTEANNWALGLAESHLVTSRIEHPAVLATCTYLATTGCATAYVDVDSLGTVVPEAFERALRPETTLASIMFANNEVGTIQPVRELASRAHAHGALFHTDAVQAFAHVPIDVQNMGIDLLSASGHKFYGPKGVGFLYARRGTPLRPFIHGGNQERRLRAGTENVAGIVGMARAVELSMVRLEEQASRETELRDRLIASVLRDVPGSYVQGHARMRLPNNASFTFDHVDGEALRVMLEQRGALVSGGSACSSGARTPSHVLRALGVPDERAQSAVRISLGRQTSKEDIDYLARTLKELVELLQAISLP